MNWFINGNHWTLCEIVSNRFGVAVVRLYNEQDTREGKARKGLYGLLIYAEAK